MEPLAAGSMKFDTQSRRHHAWPYAERSTRISAPDASPACCSCAGGSVPPTAKS